MSELAVIGYDVHGCNIVEIVNKKQPDVRKPTVNLKEQETKPVYKRENGEKSSASSNRFFFFLFFSLGRADFS